MSASTPQGTIFDSTGDMALDAAISGEASTLRGVFGVSPSLYALAESDGQANAFANCGNNRIVLGMQLLREELWSMDRGTMAVAGIMAHEFAHIYQCSRSSDLDGKYRELQADYLAGWYMRSKASQGFDITGFANSVFSKGDYDFSSPRHHGTREERVETMLTGFRDSSTSVSSAYANSLGTSRSGTESRRVERPTTRTCTRRVSCSHTRTCSHQRSCSHSTACSHQVSCSHRASCSHTMPCGHRMPCSHYIQTMYGPRQQHQFDTQHPFDTRHPFDAQHPFDTRHRADSRHPYDLEHPRGDRVHDHDTETYTCSG